MYPEELLPQPNYAQCINIDSLLVEVRDILVARRTSEQPTFYGDDNHRHLSMDCLTDDENLFNYSMNILGGGFDVEKHLCYRQLGKGKDRWQGEENLTQDEMDGLWTCEDGYPLYFYLNDLNIKRFPYSKTFRRQDYEKLKQNSKLKEAIGIWESKNKPVTLTGMTKVNHIPTRLNYWHVTLDIYDLATGELLIRSKAKWQKTINTFLVSFLRDHCVEPKNVAICVIPSMFYEESKTSAP